MLDNRGLGLRRIAAAAAVIVGLAVAVGGLAALSGDSVETAAAAGVGRTRADHPGKGNGLDERAEADDSEESRTLKVRGKGRQRRTLTVTDDKTDPVGDGSEDSDGSGDDSVDTGEPDTGSEPDTTDDAEPTEPADPDPTPTPTTGGTETSEVTTTDRPPTTAAPTTAPEPTSAPEPTTTVRPTTTAAPTTTTEKVTTTTDGRGGGALVWEENFDRLDTTRWRIEHSDYGAPNGEVHCYTPDNVWVADGKLTLRARKETYSCPGGRTQQYTSGMVRLRGVEFKPGQALEFRVKLNPENRNNQVGLFPAVWSSSWAGRWPVGGEIDYLEVMGAEDPKRAMFSMHYADSSGRHRLKNKGAYLSNYFSDEWHTIRFEYGYNGVLRWFMDGRQTFEVDDAPTQQGYPAPFNQAIHEIKINFALGGKPGALSSGALSSSGATFQVDYLRIYNL